MKAITTILLCCANLALVHSQPTQQASAHLPTIGSSRPIYSATITADAPPGGPDVVFDFSGLLSSGTVIVQHVAPSTTTNGALYPQAQVASVAGSGEVRYWSLAVEGLLEHGIDVGTCAFAWSDPMVVLLPTFTLNDAWSDTYAGSCSLGLFSIDEVGTYDAEVDGWGTLIMPQNTFTDVLRVRADKYYSNIFAGVTTDWHQVIHEYYAEGFAEPVLSTVRLFQVVVDTETELAYNANWIIEPGLGYAEDAALTSTARVHPNPTANTLSVTFSDDLPWTATLVDPTGRTVLRTGPTRSLLRWDVSPLAPGTYLLHLTTTDGRASQVVRVVKE